MRKGSGTSTTLRGSGWLRESPRNHVPPEWLEIRGHSILRKCLFLPALREPSGPHHRAPVREIHDTEVMPVVRHPEPPIYVPPRRIDPLRQVRMIPALASPYENAEAYDAAYAKAKAKMNARARLDEGPITPRRAWARSDRTPRRARESGSVFSSPLMVGLLMMVLPPVGVAAAWSSPRYDREGRIAVTITASLFMCLATVAVVLLAR